MRLCINARFRKNNQKKTPSKIESTFLLCHIRKNSTNWKINFFRYDPSNSAIYNNILYLTTVYCPTVTIILVLIKFFLVPIVGGEGRSSSLVLLFSPEHSVSNTKNIQVGGITWAFVKMFLEESECLVITQRRLRILLHLYQQDTILDHLHHHVDAP